MLILPKKIWFRRSITWLEYLSRCQEQKHSMGNGCDHTGEKCGIKIQGPALMFTQEETRTWWILGFWISEFIASRPTSNSAPHTFPFVGKTVMPEYCRVHPRRLFPPRPSGPGLHNWAGRRHWRKVKRSDLPATAHRHSAAKTCVLWERSKHCCCGWFKASQKLHRFLEFYSTRFYLDIL